jgi:hypothetical protein
MAAFQVPLFVVAGFSILLGAYHIARECHASWYEDGGVLYEDDGTEVIFSPNPIRIGRVLLSWKGPLWMAAGFGMAIGLMGLLCRERQADVS